MEADNVGPDTPLHRSEHALAEQVEGETVVLDPIGDRYVRLNATGAFVFDRLEHGAATPAGLAAQLAERHGIAEERALEDLLAFARDMTDRGLLRAG